MVRRLTRIIRDGTSNREAAFDTFVYLCRLVRTLVTFADGIRDHDFMDNIRFFRVAVVARVLDALARASPVACEQLAAALLPLMRATKRGKFAAWGVAAAAMLYQITRRGCDAPLAERIASSGALPLIVYCGTLVMPGAQTYSVQADIGQSCAAGILGSIAASGSAAAAAVRDAGAVLALTALLRSSAATVAAAARDALRVLVPAGVPADHAAAPAASGEQAAEPQRAAAPATQAAAQAAGSTAEAHTPLQPASIAAPCEAGSGQASAAEAKPPFKPRTVAAPAPAVDAAASLPRPAAGRAAPVEAASSAVDAAAADRAGRRKRSGQSSKAFCAGRRSSCQGRSAERGLRQSQRCSRRDCIQRRCMQQRCFARQGSAALHRCVRRSLPANVRRQRGRFDPPAAAAAGSAGAGG